MIRESEDLPGQKWRELHGQGRHLKDRVDKKGTSPDRFFDPGMSLFFGGEQGNSPLAMKFLKIKEI